MQGGTRADILGLGFPPFVFYMIGCDWKKRVHQVMTIQRKCFAGI